MACSLPPPPPFLFLSHPLTQKPCSSLSPTTSLHQRDAWRAERATLVTNMSSLFLTAKAELARKDAAVREARAAAAGGGGGKA